jgi:AcrR family transcriptional regulator
LTGALARLRMLFANMVSRSIKKPRRKSDLATRTIKSPRGEGQSSTARILVAAEEVFANQGFDATSVRQVAREAGVPMALVLYHFGDKLGLYRAIFEVRAPAIIEQRKAGLALADLEPDPERKLDLILKAMLVPMLRLRAAEQSNRFGRLIAREISDPASIERGIVKDMLDPIAEAVITRLASVLPDRSKAEIHWIFQILVGAVIYPMADGGRIRRLSRGAADPADIEATVATMINILLDGIRPRAAPRVPSRAAQRARNRAR